MRLIEERSSKMFQQNVPAVVIRELLSTIATNWTGPNRWSFTEDAPIREPDEEVRAPLQFRILNWDRQSARVRSGRAKRSKLIDQREACERELNESELKVNRVKANWVEEDRVKESWIVETTWTSPSLEPSRSASNPKVVSILNENRQNVH